MAELADALDLGSSAARHAGSTPVTRTITSVLIGFEYPIRTLVSYAHFASLTGSGRRRIVCHNDPSPGLHRDLWKRNIHLIWNLNRTDTVIDNADSLCAAARGVFCLVYFYTCLLYTSDAADD